LATLAAVPSLPPGPRGSQALHTLGWLARPGPFLERCRARYGDMFTLRLAHEGAWVMLSDPDAVRQVFTGDPAVFHAGEANTVLRPLLGRSSVLLQARDEDGSPMRDEELRDELVTLLVAGHETTATSLAWALERLLRHPAAWARLREEAATGDGGYAEAVVHETLRLRPVIPIVIRRLKADVEIGGRWLPAGANATPCIYLMHRREDLYPEPHAFRPERFVGVKPGTYTWIPFGGGVRRCLGASFALFEMRTVLGAVVRGASLEPSTPAGERVRRRAITLTPEHGASARVRPIA
jgi:cytochrome P450